MFSPSRRGSRIAQSGVGLFALLRVLALVVGLQLSGLAPGLTELVCFATEMLEHDEPCAGEEPCSDCAPGCATCHCPSGLRSIAPEPHVWATANFSPAALVALDEASQAPPGPDLPSLFRPPRSTSHT